MFLVWVESLMGDQSLLVWSLGAFTLDSCGGHHWIRVYRREAYNPFIL